MAHHSAINLKASTPKSKFNHLLNKAESVFFGLQQIVIKMKDGECPSPKAMAKQVLCYLEENGYFQA